MTALLLPISIYQYDSRAKRYAFQSCLQFPLDSNPLPHTLTSSTSAGIVSENIDLLKTAMRAPAVVLRKGTRVRIYNASCEEVQTLPPAEPVRVLRAYELPYLNLSTQIAHYRLRADGALVLADVCRLHCAMCHIPEYMELDYIRTHLWSRRHTIRKLLRDRRLVVEIGDRTTLFSIETLRRQKGQPLTRAQAIGAMKLCPVIDGKSTPTTADVDQSVEARGIRKTFDGVVADHVCAHNLVEIDGFYVTESVGFGFFYLASTIWLVVVSRKDTDIIYGFRAGQRDRTFVYQSTRDTMVCEQANQIRAAIAKCPAKPTQTEIAQVVSQTVQPSIETIRTDTSHSVRRVRIEMLIAVFVLVFAGVGVLAWVLDRILSTMSAIEARSSGNIRAIQTENIAQDSRISAVENATGTVVTVMAVHGSTLQELKRNSNDLQIRVSEQERVNERQDHQLEYIETQIHVLKHQKPLAIEGPPQTTGKELALRVPTSDSLFNYLWSVTSGLVCLVSAVLFLCIVAQVIGEYACDLEKKKTEKKKKRA